MLPKTRHASYKLHTYDVWGNHKDGYEVNDKYPGHMITLLEQLKIYNPETPNQFISYELSDYQIKKAFGVGCKIDTDGDDDIIYVNRASDGYPIGELVRLSQP